MKALYIHIPFCSKVCTYCDFYKMVAKDSLKEKYIEYLIKELEMKKEYFTELETIYIGGGTPTSLNPSLLKQLFSYLKENIDFKKIKEFTVEVNPKDVTYELASLFATFKVNRISLGVQSLKRRKLKFLGRDHRYRDVKKAINTLKEVGIYNINCDIIFGAKRDSKRIVIRDLKKLLKMNITHISTYSLQLEQKTILYKLFKENKFKPISEELDSEIYNAVCTFLKEKEFDHYEVSNFALNKDFRSLHNLTYWNNEKYIGVGAAASYYIDNVRYTNVYNLSKYFEGIDKGELNYFEVDEIVLGEKLFEEVMLGFRKLDGINLNNFKEKYGKEIVEVFPVVNELLEKGDLVIENEYIKVPENKIFILNNILINFLSEDNFNNLENNNNEDEISNEDDSLEMVSENNEEVNSIENE